MSYAVTDTRMRRRSPAATAAPTRHAAAPARSARQCASHACSRQARQQQLLQQQ